MTTSHEAMASFTTLEDPALTGPSFCSKWTIAQVLSHLGSGAEIGMLRLRAALDNAPPPQLEELRAIWARWDAASPKEQAKGALKEDAEYLELVAGLEEGQLDTAKAQLLRSEASIHDLLAFRLLEHALHVWDMQVVGNPEAVLAQGAVALLLDPLAMLASRIAKLPEEGPREDFNLQIRTIDPESVWEVSASGSQISVERLEPPVERLEEPSMSTEALLLPAETWIRLVTGRLKEPEKTAKAVELAEYFPGY